MSADILTSYLPLYQAVTAHLPTPPNVGIVQERQPLPEDWPVMLAAIHTGRGGYLETVEVTDGVSSVHCVTRIPDVANRLVGFEPGTMLHILGGEVRYSDAHQAYILDIEQVCTLKEYDALLKQREAQQTEQAAQQREWLEATYLNPHGDNSDSASAADAE